MIKNRTKILLVLPMLFLTLGFAAAEAVDMSDMSISRQLDINKALDIANKVPYVRDFGIVDSINIVNDHDRAVWDIVKVNDQGGILHVWVNPETESVIKVETTGVSLSDTGPTKNVKRSHEQELDYEYLKYGEMYDEHYYDYHVRLTVDEALKIAERVPVFRDAGAVDWEKTRLINDHGILMWQFLKTDSEGRPTMVAWVNARNGAVMRAESSLKDLVEAE